MVLSNKKLKQKLRSEKAELIVEAEAQINLIYKDNKNSKTWDSKNSNSLTTLLNPETQKARLSKREKRRQNAPSLPQENKDTVNDIEISVDGKGEKEGELKSDDVKKKKKRKRDESTELENVDEKKTEKVVKKKKKIKNKRKNKKAGNGTVKEDIIEQNGIGISEEKLPEKSDEGFDSITDVETCAKVYVGGIPYYSTEDDIRSFFEGCGTITSVDCMYFPDTGKFRGIAIITFKTEAAAKRALALDGSDMGGLFLKIQPFKSANKPTKSPNFCPTILPGYNRIYVGNLSWDITDNDLKELFSDCSITSIRFGEDKVTKEFKGYAHVDFADSLSLNMALKLDQSIVRERPVRITCAVPKRESNVAKSKSTPEESQVGNGAVRAVRTDDSVVNANSGKVGADGVGASMYMQKESQFWNSAVRAVVRTDESVVKAESGAVRIGAVSEVKVDSSVEVPVASSKIRRRTCYECGERGHLSSSCPKKQADGMANSEGQKISQENFDY